MKITKTFLLTSWLVGIMATGLRAQQGQSAAGGDIYGSGGSVSFTIGQADYVTTAGSGGTITQGIQQPIEIMVVSGIEQTAIQLKCAVYPNPTTDYVILNVQQPISDEISLLLYNTSGSILGLQKLAGSETKISLAGFADGIYYIKILNDNKEEKTFKIIKHS